MDMSDVENYTERDYAGSSIKIISWIDRVQAIISINVFVGAYRSDLSKTFPLHEREAAATHYAFVQNGARAGRTEAALIADLQRTPLGATYAAAAGNYRSVRATRTRVHTKALTAEQRNLIIAARVTGGVLDLGEGSPVKSWLTLRAIVDKGFAEVIDQASTGKILAIRVHA